MSDKIKSNVTTAYMLFIFEFADPSQVRVDIKIPIESLFDSQKSADKMKSSLGRDGFNNALALYFNQFQTQTGVDCYGLETAIAKNKKVLIRHLGKDKVAYLSLIVNILKSLETPRRGLLAS